MADTKTYNGNGYNGDGFQTQGDATGIYTNTGVAYAWGVRQPIDGGDSGTGSGGTGDGSTGDTAPIFGIDPTFGIPLTGATSQNDFYQGGSGGGIIDGLDGKDTAVYGGNVTDYQIKVVDGQVFVTGPNGVTDILVNFERAQFGDYVLVFDYNTPKDDFLYQLYQAAFDRVPDVGGYEWWAGRVQNENLSEVDLAKGFLAAPENVTLYGNAVSNADFITNLYDNILDRAPEQQGYDYWLGQINAGVSRAEILIAFTVSQENIEITAPRIDNGMWMTP